MRLTAWALVVAIAGMAHADSPEKSAPPQRAATQPVHRTLEKLKARAAKAQAAVKTATAAAQKRAASTKRYKSAAAAEAKAAKRLDNARKDDDPKEKLKASAAHLKAKASLDKVVRDALARDEELKTAQEHLAKARLAVGKAIQEQRAKDLEELRQRPVDRIAVAISNGDLAIGMTLAQAEKAMKRKGTLVAEDTAGQEFKWNAHVRPDDPPEVGFWIYYARFDAGKLTSFERVSGGPPVRARSVDPRRQF